jgi:hypothetical protein
MNLGRRVTIRSPRFRVTAPVLHRVPSTSAVGAMVGVREYFGGSYIVQHGKPHKLFARRGNDLLCAL